MECWFEKRKVLACMLLAAAPLLALADQSGPVAEVTAQEEQKSELVIKREPHLRKMPDAAVAEKKLFVSFKGSPKMSKLLQAKLSDSRLVIVETPEEAELKVEFSGMYFVQNASKERKSGQLGELLEEATADIAPDRPNYRVESVDIPQMLAVRAGTGAFAITDIALWISQQTGIAGRFNEWLTGDPGGWCLNEACRKQRRQLMNVAIVSVSTGGEFHWWLKHEAWDEKVVLDRVIADALEHAIRPLAELKKTAPVAVAQ